jgi:alpha-beta hydrolase superfamily lysophospholipase
MNHNLPILLISGKDDPFGEYGKGVKKLGKIYKKAGF